MIEMLKAAVTVWIRWQPPIGKKPGYWSMNHLEDGHVDQATPTDNFKVGWSGGKWRKAFGWLELGAGQDGSDKLVYDKTGVFEVNA
jgi:hypothetical protein